VLESVLKETYGIMVYRSRAAGRGASSPVSAWEGRHPAPRDGQEEPEEMAKQRQAFTEGCVKKKTCTAAKAGQNLRPDFRVRVLRLQQVALGGVRDL
jgi:hypothetical protein